MFLLLFSLYLPVPSSSVDDVTSDVKWYLNSDEEEEGSSISPSHIIPISNPTGLTSPQQPASPDLSNKEHLPEAPKSTGDKTSSTSHRVVQSTSQTGLAGQINDNLQVDGNFLMKHVSNGKVKKQLLKPVVPPKAKRQRSKSTGTILAGRKPGSSRTIQTGASHRTAVGLVPHLRSTSDVSDDNQTSLTSLESYVSSGNSSQVSKSSVVSKTSSSSQGSKSVPLNHDYAILEDPRDHDYAILDPEYHEEFYGT